MEYSKIIKQVFKENSAIVIKYWWAFLGMSSLYHLYQYLILKFVNVDSKYLHKIMSAYHILIYPLLVLIIMYLVDCYNKNRLPVDFNKLIKDAKRCYIRIILIYLAMDLIRRYFGLGAILIVFTIMYVKLPFLEQEIFFKDSSLWGAIKNTNELTNEGDIIKTITILVLVFLVVYFVLEKIMRIVLNSYIDYKRMVLVGVSIVELTFFLFCKAVLTKVYSNIK